MLVSIEGIDGAGKNTLVNRIKGELSVEVDVLGFPRYEESVHAQLAQEALYGRMGDLTDSAYAMATLFALDRFGAKDCLLEAQEGKDLLILDRYVASNAAYSAARLGTDEVVDWVYDLEFSRLGLPKPSLQIFLDTDVELAAARAEARAAEDAGRARDRYEKDSDLQTNTAAAYRRLAERAWGGRWIATADTDMIVQSVKELVEE
ncbi:thymidylate kinase [Corynebacterium sp. HMSC06D04]|uniref:Thymidylate kinase n=1 Tax=Corynebacterium simulans TaxID=146827 RepID=A0ABR5VBR0_9CORY|nr:MULTISPECIES: dTMP kinase [Corynebacterium]KXU18685.1 thymidylate kinase [Corynebacterium simulans]OFM02829.1 thymidylate kinase [Corynebacterium sp. HMSC071F07]OFT36323.1 thymidylate kinase [Corynebacterium sp. HMSC08C04]OFT53084.1 thymidylate kinase [Corynebacterium sp. HMSC06D04]OHO67197.1 thymidylate kinase [Corynebacterium sp. HMSC036D03]